MGIGRYGANASQVNNMKRVRKINWLGIVERHGNGLELLKQSGDCVLVERGYPRNLLFKCPDSCGEVITINLDPASGPAWKYYERNGVRTLYPSVALITGCESHFILWRDQILWCDGDRYRGDISVDKALIAAVRNQLRTTQSHFSEIASQLGELPWEVLWACRELVRAGYAKEPKFGYFFLNPKSPESHKTFIKTISEDD